MRRSRRTRTIGALGVVAAAALITALTACGSSSNSSKSTTTATSSTSTSGNATTSTTSGGSATTGACAASDLAIGLNTSGSGAAGSVYYTLKFTNTSGHSCTLAGYSGVSGVNSAGTQLGSAAGRNTTTPATTVTLASGATAISTLQITDVGNFTASTCGPTTAAGLRVFAPNQTASTRLVFAFQACAKSGPVYLHVTPVVLSGSSGGGGGVVATPTCTTPELSVRLGTNGSGAAGSIYYPLNFTNRSGHACTLAGYPGISAVSASGGQLGSAAGRDTTTAAKTLTLANGGTATSTLQIAEVGNYPTATCQPAQAAGLRVFPPNQTSSVSITFSFQGCAKAGPVYLHVTAVG
jgi:hypothetical protein